MIRSEKITIQKKKVVTDMGFETKVKAGIEGVSGDIGADLKHNCVE